MYQKNIIQNIKKAAAFGKSLGKRADAEILDMLFPPRCPFCDRLTVRKKGICDSCKRKIPYVLEPACKKCGKALSNEQQEYCLDCQKKTHMFTQGKALFSYAGRVKDSIYRFKYKNRREYARIYAEEIVKRYGNWIRQREIEGIVPVPLHKSKKRSRGYNQSQILAEELGNCLGIPVYTQYLQRVKKTKDQKSLKNSKERKNNMKNAFKTSQNVVQLEHILMVDDVYTTGSTIDAAAEALLAAGVKKVYTCCISIGNNT